MGKTMKIMMALLLCLGALRAEESATSDVDPTTLPAAREKGLKWIAENQKEDGSWGGGYSIAVTSFACLSFLSAVDEPFEGGQGEVLLKGLKYLLSMQKDGTFANQGHTWIHGQGFAALALSEAYGRSLFCESKPDLDMEKLKAAVASAVKVIEENQSTSGGWWYTQGNRNNHEGSTTVTAVQAMVSAKNYGFEIDDDVLQKGFEYLKKSQNKDGGFDYRLDNRPDTVSMKEGTAADVSTLALMKKFDYAVMMKGYKFLLETTPEVISNERFPYYGHFYGCMGMKLLGEELQSLQEKTGGYIAAAQKGILAWQAENGSWPLKSWMLGKESEAYSTAFATLVLSVPDGRLSIFQRTPPKLPVTEIKDDEKREG